MKALAIVCAVLFLASVLACCPMMPSRSRTESVPSQPKAQPQLSDVAGPKEEQPREQPKITQAQPKITQAPKNAAPAFDPTDSLKTLAWLEHRGAAWMRPGGNDAAAEESQRQLQEALVGIVGQRVNWAMPFKRLTKSGNMALMTTAPLSRKYTYDDMKTVADEIELLNVPKGMFPAMVLSMTGDPKADLLRTIDGTFAVPYESWMLKLRQGDRVIVTGTLYNTYHHRDGVSNTATGRRLIERCMFRLLDATLAPAGQ
jgi:hypothetical protein